MLSQQYLAFYSAFEILTLHYSTGEVLVWIFPVCVVTTGRRSSNPLIHRQDANQVLSEPLWEDRYHDDADYGYGDSCDNYVHAGIDNDVFYNEHTMMLFDDAKKMLEKIVHALD